MTDPTPSRPLAVDGASAGGLQTVSDDARELERLGYNALSVPEVDHDGLLPLVLAAQATERIELGTSILVAFARSPMTTASAVWDLQAFSGGRIVLGLGTQIRPHIERRFSMPWSAPAARMREYVAALHAIWDTWQTGAPLDFHGDFYTHTLMTPMFEPGALDTPWPRILLAAVGPRMLRTAAEVADGVILHGFSTARYEREAVLPVLRGSRSGGDPFDVRVSPFLVAEPDGPAREAALRTTRERIAFYGSTPAYRPVLEAHGWGELQTELRTLSRQGRWVEMGELIDDDVLVAFAVVCEPHEVVDRLRERVRGIGTRVSFTPPADADPDWRAEVVARLRETAVGELTDPVAR